MKVSDVEVGKTYKLLRHGERVVYKTIVIAARGDDKFLCVTLDPLNKRGRLFLLSVKKEITKRIRVLSSNRFIRAIALTIERAYPPEPKVVDEVVSAQELIDRFDPFALGNNKDAELLDIGTTSEDTLLYEFCHQAKATAISVISSDVVKKLDFNTYRIFLTDPEHLNDRVVVLELEVPSGALTGEIDFWKWYEDFSISVTGIVRAENVDIPPTTGAKAIIDEEEMSLVSCLDRTWFGYEIRLTDPTTLGDREVLLDVNVDVTAFSGELDTRYASPDADEWHDSFHGDILNLALISEKQASTQ